MTWIYFASIREAAIDGTVVSALVAFGAAGPILAMAYLLITSQRAERKENSDAQAVERKELREWMQGMQDQLMAIAKDKGVVIKDNTEAMTLLKVEMARLITRLGQASEGVAQLGQKIEAVSTPVKRGRDGT